MATTWNPSDKGAGITLSGGNLTAVGTGGTDDAVRSTTTPASKAYAEITLGSVSNTRVLGLSNASQAVTSSVLGSTANGVGYNSGSGVAQKNGSNVGVWASLANGDVLGIAYDPVNGTVAFYKNNTLQGTLTGGNVPTGALYVTFNSPGVNTDCTVNFGGTAFAFTPPSGFVAWDSALGTVITTSLGVTVGVAAVIAGQSAATQLGVTLGIASVMSFHSALIVPTALGVNIGLASALEFVAALKGPVVAAAPAAKAVLVGRVLPTGVLAARAYPARAVISARITELAKVTATAPRAKAVLAGGVRSLIATAPKATAAITALLGGAAVVATKAPRASAVLSGVVTGLGAVAGKAKAPTAVVTALLGTAATIKTTAPKARATLAVFATIQGVIHAKSRVPVSSFKGGMGFQVVLAFTAPAARARITASQTVDTWTRSVVANTITAAVTEFESYQYDSFAQINGTWYAAGSDGLYELDSSGTDNGVPIAAYFETGALDFKSEYLKRFESLYAAYRTTGDVRVTVKTDEGKSYIYTMKYDRVPTIKQRRVDVGKGLKGKYWQLRFDNVAGCGFGFDTFNALAHETVRRIGV